MIQRAGRIDRIGTPHDEIFIHNFFPSDELEDLLELVQVLEDKISDIDQAVGMDQKVIDDEINPKVFGTTSSLDEDTLKRIQENDQSVMDDLSDDVLGGGEGFWQPIRKAMNDSFREDMESIPYGVYSGHKNDARGIFFYYQYGEDFHYWYYCDLTNNRIIENKSEILNKISVEPDEERIVPDDLFEKVYAKSTEVRNEIERDYKEVEQSSADDKKREWDNDRSKKFLITMTEALKENLRQHLRKYPDDVETDEQIKDIQEKLKKITLTKARTSEVRRYWRRYKGDEGHGDWKKLADQLGDFLENKSEAKGSELEEFNEEKLKLVAVEFIS
jgi:hypothetical protein